MDNKKKAFGCLCLILAFLGIALALQAQETADINNVFAIVVNNTNLAPSFPGEIPGTGERVAGVTYWANTSPIEIFVWAHAMTAGDTAEIHLFINGTKVQDTSGRPLGGSPETSNKSIAAIIPKGANYSVEFNNEHHYEWREYPILSGKNGTLSLNVTGDYVNKTGDTMTGMLNASATINTTYINITYDARARRFRTAFNAYIATDTLGSNELDFFTGGTHNMKITTSGRLYAYGISASSQSNAVCYNSGTGEITYNSGITSCVASNESLKTNITNITGTITPFLLQLQPIKYNLAFENSDVYHVGLSAQSVKEVLNGTPYENTMIGYNPDGSISGLRYEELTPFLIKVIQEQQKTINKMCSNQPSLCR